MPNADQLAADERDAQELANFRRRQREQQEIRWRTALRGLTDDELEAAAYRHWERVRRAPIYLTDEEEKSSWITLIEILLGSARAVRIELDRRRFDASLVERDFDRYERFVGLSTDFANSEREAEIRLYMYRLDLDRQKLVAERARYAREAVPLPLPPVREAVPPPVPQAVREELRRPRTRRVVPLRLAIRGPGGLAEVPARPQR